MRRSLDGAALFAIGALASSGAASQTPPGGVAQGEITSTLTITPGGPIALQLEVYINSQPRHLISSFTLYPDGRITSPASELIEIGLELPPGLRNAQEVDIGALFDVSFSYDEAAQTIRFVTGPRALRPATLDARPSQAFASPERPPPGTVLNYTLYASGSDAVKSWTFDGVSAGLGLRTFGGFGLVENTFASRFGGPDDDFVRLDSTYVRENLDNARSFRAGDFISGGFSWTRPVRMGGLQLRRNFGLRPDIITVPTPALNGSAAAPSTVELFINGVRTWTDDVGAGPFEILHPPVVYGGGSASVVVRDVLGRQTVSTTPFYASPALLAPGLSDYSVEIGFARRNYGLASDDYVSTPAGSASWRGGITDNLTLQAHAEATEGLANFGGGAAATLGHFGLASIAVAGSSSDAGSGTLVDVGFESRMPGFSITTRSQRILADYDDLASWTDAAMRQGSRPIFGQPREFDQISLSSPLPWSGGSWGTSFVRAVHDVEPESNLLSLYYTHDLGPVSLFATGVKDTNTSGSDGLFVGFSLPMGHGVSGSSGASHRRGGTSAFVQASKQQRRGAGSLGWAVRADAGENNDLEGAVRYATTFADLEAGVRVADGVTSANAVMEGAIAAIGGGLHLTEHINGSFALVDVGAPDVEVLHENRVIGRTDRNGRILVPELTAYTPNRIAIDPENLPIDARVVSTNARIVPYGRVGAKVDLRVQLDTQSALVELLDRTGAPLPAGSVVTVATGGKFVVGYDGLAFMDGLKATNRVTVTRPDGATCVASFAFKAARGEQVRIGGVRCAAS